ncbi:MAG TPA: hypothetical protein VF407_24465 [Polyangiaceae bacterium]
MGVGRRFVVVAAIVAGSSFVRHARAQMPPREVTVHLEARPDVTLERREDNDWVEVCFAPCDLKFPTLGEYRVGGGIRDSDPFRLRQTSPGLSVVAVDPRSRGAHAAGDVLIGVGSALTAVGALSAFLGAASGGCEDTHDACNARNIVVPSLAVALVGIGVIVLGVDLAVVNGRSRVRF